MEKLQPVLIEKRVEPLCPYFGPCGGCAYQDLPYEEELTLKAENLKLLFQKELGLSVEIFEPIVPSPEPYFYRSRLDLSFRRTRAGMKIGFMQKGTRRLVEIDSCAIARPEISHFLPSLKKLAEERLPQNYRTANLVVKTGDGKEIRWGGIGRGSLRLPEQDYFWTEIEGKRIFYSLDTFFQANLGILPDFIQKLRYLLELSPETYLLDLYSGVGLFWIVFASEARGVYAIEENGSAIRVAGFNRRYHELSQVTIVEGRTEDRLDEILDALRGKPCVAIVDPPRKGLTPLAREKLSKADPIDRLLYISCQPDALVRDLEAFLRAGWEVDCVIPFDFFPRTRHLEVAARLLSKR